MRSKFSAFSSHNGAYEADFLTKTKVNTGRLHTFYLLSASWSFGPHWNKPPERGITLCLCNCSGLWVCSCWATLLILVASTTGKPARHCSTSYFYHWEKSYIVLWVCGGVLCVSLLYAQVYFIFNSSKVICLGGWMGCTMQSMSVRVTWKYLKIWVSLEFHGPNGPKLIVVWIWFCLAVLAFNYLLLLCHFLYVTLQTHS